MIDTHVTKTGAKKTRRRGGCMYGEKGKPNTDLIPLSPGLNPIKLKVLHIKLHKMYFV